MQRPPGRASSDPADLERDGLAGERACRHRIGARLDTRYPVTWARTSVARTRHRRDMGVTCLDRLRARVPFPTFDAGPDRALRTAGAQAKPVVRTGASWRPVPAPQVPPAAAPEPELDATTSAECGSMWTPLTVRRSARRSLPIRGLTHSGSCRSRGHRPAPRLRTGLGWGCHRRR